MGVLAIIGGTGLYELGQGARDEVIATPYGEASVTRTTVGDREVLFLARHGAGHAVPPHRINYRANIWALHALGVHEVVATQAVGSVNLTMPPGDFVLISQFLDWTKDRPTTFFDGESGVVVHADVTHPYCARVIGKLARAAREADTPVHGIGVYACTEGPRFETSAEIHALRTLGADLVGMTNVPEVVLAREAGLCYAALCIVCNWGAGMTDVPLTQEEVLEIMAHRGDALRAVLTQYLRQSDDGTPCLCASLGHARHLPRLGAQ